MAQVHKCQWVVLQVILNIICGSKMEVPLSTVKKSDFEHYIWLRSEGTSLEIRKMV